MNLVMYFNVLFVLLFGLIWTGVVLFLRLKKNKNFVYLLFFTIFYIYLFKVLDYTLFQFQSLILLKHFMPNLMLRGQEHGETMNLIPLITLTLKDLQTSLLNILLFLPFGFGLPFITSHRMKNVIIFGALFSLAIELLQLVSGILGKIAFRVADINDLIFNTMGVALGYILFVGFMRAFQSIFYKSKKITNPILKYIAMRPQV